MRRIHISLPTASTRRLWVTAVASLVLAAPATGEDEPSPQRLAELVAKAGNPEPPPRVIPSGDPNTPPVNLVYLFERNTCLLHDGTFYLFLPDFPRALLVKCQATYLAVDKRFFYYHETRFDREWAFGREPADNFFAGHAVWSRKRGTTDWRLSSSEAVMATPYPWRADPARK